MGTFAAACGFSNDRMVVLAYQAYGISHFSFNPATNSFSNEYLPNTQDLEIWWEKRDFLHELIASGITWQEARDSTDPEIRNLWRVLQLFTAPD